jgi:hypothetical protein
LPNSSILSLELFHLSHFFRSTLLQILPQSLPEVKICEVDPLDCEKHSIQTAVPFMTSIIILRPMSWILLLSPMSIIWLNICFRVVVGS